MARKKSKGSKKSRAKKARKSQPAAPPAEESGAYAEESSENAAVADPPLERGSGASRTGSAPEEEELISIDLDEEIDDAEARQRVIEEAVAFVAAEQRGDSPAPAIEEDGTGGENDEPRADDAPTIAGGEHEGGDTDGDAKPPSSENRDQPLIGMEALRALSDIRAEGLASLPQELVLDLGDALTPEERDRLLSSALAHAEMQEAIYRIPVEERRSRRIKSTIAATIFLVAALVAVNPPTLIVPAPPPALSESDLERGILVALTLQAQKVEAFQVTNGRLPRSIAEVEEGIPDIRLVRSSNRLYQLIAYGPDGEPVVYDSSVPAPDFERLWRNWSTTADDDFGGLR